MGVSGYSKQHGVIIFCIICCRCSCSARENAVGIQRGGGVEGGKWVTCSRVVDYISRPGHAKTNKNL